MNEFNIIISPTNYDHLIHFYCVSEDTSISFIYNTLTNIFPYKENHFTTKMIRQRYNLKKMSYGVIEYDNNGLPICEICGKSFNRVLSHVRQKHDMNERDYKLKFGFDLRKGICSKESSEATRVKTLENYDKVIGQNLLNGGVKSRFTDGHMGRVKEMVSEQTRMMLKERLTKPYMKEAMKKAGEKLGKSGLGNKKRWGDGN